MNPIITSQPISRYGFDTGIATKTHVISHEGSHPDPHVVYYGNLR